MALATFVLSATTPVALAPMAVSVRRARLQPTRDSSTTPTIFASAWIGSTMMGPTSSACPAFTPASLVRLPPALASPATPLLIENYSATTVTVCHASTMIWPSTAFPAITPVSPAPETMPALPVMQLNIDKPI